MTNLGIFYVFLGKNDKKFENWKYLFLSFSKLEIPIFVSFLVIFKTGKIKLVKFENWQTKISHFD